MRFVISRPRFGHRTDDPDEDAGLPTPHRMKAQARRAAAIAEAKAIVPHLPGPGEAMHVLISGRVDGADVLDSILASVGTPSVLTVASLGFNARNRRTVLQWLDTGRVSRLTLLVSLFFRAHNGELWSRTLDDLRQRGQRAACAPSHAKVAVIEFDGGPTYVVEGSSNLCASGSAREQQAVIADRDLANWHRRWIEELVLRHETTDASND
jgi:hypothetical protein